MTEEEFMKRAMDLASENIDNGGGPFGAVIVMDGKIIAEGSNRVTRENDPTAHAEIVAIRDAASKLKNFNLEGCQIYASCEPCPMCLSAIYWARIPVVYYSADRKDAENAGFDDTHIYEQMPLQNEERDILMKRILPDLSSDVFNKWNEQADKTSY